MRDSQGDSEGDCEEDCEVPCATARDCERESRGL